MAWISTCCRFPAANYCHVVASDQPGIGGWCDPRVAAVREAFTANFAERGETGAAACLTVHGTVVADLWGGVAGRGPWQRDTLVNVFSVGKGLVAACAARLIGRRRLDPDAR